MGRPSIVRSGGRREPFPYLFNQRPQASLDLLQARLASLPTVDSQDSLDAVRDIKRKVSALADVTEREKRILQERYKKYFNDIGLPFERFSFASTLISGSAFSKERLKSTGLGRQVEQATRTLRDVDEEEDLRLFEVAFDPLCGFFEELQDQGTQLHVVRVIPVFSNSRNYDLKEVFNLLHNHAPLAELKMCARRFPLPRTAQ